MITTTETPPMGLLDRARSALGVLVTGKQPSANPLAQDPDDKSRGALVKELNDWCVTERAFWKPIFDRMKEEQRFAAGKQWPKDYKPKNDWASMEAYVGDVIQQLLNRKTATLYAKNPTPEARQRESMPFTIWDGEQDSIDGAKAMIAEAAPMIAQAKAAAAAGQEVPPPPMELKQAMDLVADYEQGMARKELLNRIAKTATLLIQRQWDLQSPSNLVANKQMVTRILTSRVGYKKIMYRRDMEPNPAQQGVSNLADKIAQLRQMVEAMAAPDFDKDSATAKEAELLLDSMQQDAQSPAQPIVESEGVVIDYPSATSIIIDRRCRSLREFVGAHRIAHEILMSVEECEARFKISLRDTGAVMYSDDGTSGSKSKDRFKTTDGEDKQPTKVCVFEVQDKDTGLCYTICDGVKDFLEEPHENEPKVRRFWSIIPTAFNVQEVEFNDPDADVTIFPRSDVRLAMPMQIDVNLAGEGLREHRTANRPCWVGVKSRFAGTAGQNDLEKLASPRAAHTVLMLENLNGNEKIADFLQPLPTQDIKPEMYSPQGAMQAMMQATGVQAADLGQQENNEKATGQQIAAHQKASTDGSNIDDLEFSLTVEAQMIWEMLIQEMPAATVKKLVGNGALWPDVPAERIAAMNEIYLQIEAGSSGRPNQMVDVQNFSIIAPQLGQLMQAEGRSLEPLIKEGVRRLGDKLDVDDFLKPAQVPPQPPAPPAPKPAAPTISFKASDLTPDERAQALAKDGIQATPGAVSAPPQKVPPQPAAKSPQQPTPQPK
jgi:hypothetical protein